MFSVSMFPSANTINLYLAASLIGFATGTAISILLLALTVRAAKLPGASAQLQYPVRDLLPNMESERSRASRRHLTCGVPEQGRTALIILACQYTAAAAWPITVLSLWTPLENALKHGTRDRSPVQATCGSLPRRTEIRCVCEWKMTASDLQSVS